MSQRQVDSATLLPVRSRGEVLHRERPDGLGWTPADAAEHDGAPNTIVETHVKSCPSRLTSMRLAHVDGALTPLKPAVRVLIETKTGSVSS